MPVSRDTILQKTIACFFFFSFLFSNKINVITSIINNIILIITSIFIISKHSSVSQILKITKVNTFFIFSLIKLGQSHEPAFKKLIVYPFNCLWLLHIFTYFFFFFFGGGGGCAFILPTPAPSLLKRLEAFFRCQLMARQQRWLYEEKYDNGKKMTEAFVGRNQEGKATVISSLFRQKLNRKYY